MKMCFFLAVTGVFLEAEVNLDPSMTTVKIHKILAYVKHPEMENKDIKRILGKCRKQIMGNG
jgi:hypothetical protein